MTLAAIIAAPTDPAPRHAFAAAIRAKDPTYADFIERQLAVRDLRRSGTEPEPAATRGLYQLAQRHGATWAGPIARKVDYFGFWGGFVEEIALDAEKLLATARELVTLAPIRHLSIRALAGAASKVAQLPILAQLASLDIGSSGVSDDDVAAIVASPHLAKLRLLRLTKNNIGIAALRAVGAAQLPALAFVEASSTDGALVVESEDWGGSTTQLAWTRNRRTLVAELGHRPWLDAQVEPSLDTL